MNRKVILLLLGVTLYSCNRKIKIPVNESVIKVYSSFWNELENFPETSGRNDDICFLSPSLGWAINNKGRLYKTEDGGNSWKLQLKKDDSFFRCITFADSLNGWLGTIGLNEKDLYSNDSIVLYETHDGGANWKPSVISGEYPTGLCGLQKVTDKMIVGCGRVRGPSFFVKTTDKGSTWKSVKLNEEAGALIVPHFFDEKNGIMIGGTSRDKLNSKALILSTKDGGDSWVKVFESSQLGEYCWKVVFPTRQVGYASIQRNVDDGNFHFLKTEDGGKTWVEKEYAKKHYFTQGIGFINDEIGWIGGSSSYGTYETKDGGETWISVPEFGKGLNKFQFFGDTLGYATGKRIYKIKLKKDDSPQSVNHR
ncbi:MAG: WD40/YVTN/BNR-like repeat-containing protein [Saprospiraceae bacterium]